MKLIKSVAVIVLSIVLFKNMSPAQEPVKVKDEASIWMKRKLEFSKGILEGLAIGDFDQITKNAQAMKALGTVEGFIRARTPGYRIQLEMFKDANEQIIEQANRDNLEGVALSFHQLTNSCVRCHKELRRVEK